MNERGQITIGDLLRRLELEGHVDAERIGRIAAHLREVDPEASDPWYLKVMTAIGAWIAGIFFLSFVACTGLIADSTIAFLFWGVLLLGGALALHRTLGRFEFANQFALALSVAAHGLLIYVASDLAPDRLRVQFGAAALTSIVLCAGLYPFYLDPIHRFLACALALGLTTGWLAVSDLPHALHAMVALEIAAICAIFSSRQIRAWHHAHAFSPLGYAAATALLVTLVVMVLAQSEIGTPLWPSSVILAAALVYLVARAGDGGGWLRSEPAWWAIGVAVLLGAVSTPGLLAALALLVLGFATEDRILEGLGIAFLPVFVVIFYYSLEVDLLTKSGILAASGAVLLLARWLAGRRPWARDEVAP